MPNVKSRAKQNQISASIYNGWLSSGNLNNWKIVDFWSSIVSLFGPYSYIYTKNNQVQLYIHHFELICILNHFYERTRAANSSLMVVDQTAVFPHASDALSRKSPSSVRLSPLWLGEESRSALLQDKQRYRAFTRLAQFKGFCLPCLRNRPLSSRLTCELIPFVSYQKCEETSHSAAYFHFKWSLFFHLYPQVAILGQRRVKTNACGASEYRLVTWRNTSLQSRLRLRFYTLRTYCQCHLVFGEVYCSNLKPEGFPHNHLNKTSCHRI